MRKKILEKRLQRLTAKKQNLTARAQASQDVNEVRAINDQLADLNAEIEEVNDELAAIAEEERAAAEQEQKTRQLPPADAHQVNGNIGVAGVIVSSTREEREVDVTSTMEYRRAFMAYIQRGVTIPAEVRGNAINTNDTGAAIPMTVMNEVINTVRKSYGNLYNKVRKMSVPGGVKIPVGALQATFKWINEKTVSPRQDAGELGAVTFGYNTAEIRIAQTFLSQILTLSAFEAELTKIIAVAYLEAMDKGIMNGSGDGSMLGVLKDPRVTNTVTMTAEEFGDWTKWRKKFFAKLPLGYRGGEFAFPLSTVETYLETMADSNKNPIFRQATGLVVNDGDAANPNGTFFGREISLVEPDVIADFDTASAGDVVGLFWQPEKYAINENFGFTMRRYFDDETNEWVDKALVVVDGKVLNPKGFYKIIKG